MTLMAFPLMAFKVASMAKCVVVLETNHEVETVLFEDCRRYHVLHLM